MAEETKHEVEATEELTDKESGVENAEMENVKEAEAQPDVLKEEENTADSAGDDEEVSEETTEDQESEEANEEAEDACDEPEAALPVAGDPNSVAQRRVLAAKLRVQSAEEEIEECIRNIQNDLSEFERYEKEKLLPVVEESQQLLESIGMEEAAIEPALTELELEDPDEEKLHIRELSSGKGGAFFLGLVAAVATVGGWYAYAVQKAGAPLVPQKLPDMGTLSTLAGKVSLLFGPTEHPPVGAAIVVGSALVVWWLVYIIISSMRAAKNQKIAAEVEEQAGLYCQKKEECKHMMEEVRDHLKALRQTVHKYEVLLAEKNAGLRRALFIEEAGDYDKLHEKSQAMAREIEEMLKELDRLLATPMAKSGILTEESAEALRHAKRVINDHILRIYS